MKPLTMLAAIVVVIAFMAGWGLTRPESDGGTTKGSKPEVPQGPTTKRLVVRDVEEGDGPRVEPGDELLVHYVAGIYETGEEIESAWVSGTPLGFRLGTGEWSWGWEKGMRGVRVGGRRELIFPTTPDARPIGSELGDTLVYVVDVIDVIPPPAKQGGSLGGRG